jgi:hypothetical protein
MGSSPFCDNLAGTAWAALWNQWRSRRVWFRRYKRQGERVNDGVNYVSFLWRREARVGPGKV